MILTQCIKISQSIGYLTPHKIWTTKKPPTTVSLAYPQAATYPSPLPLKLSSSIGVNKPFNDPVDVSTSGILSSKLNGGNGDEGASSASGETVIGPFSFSSSG